MDSSSTYLDLLNTPSAGSNRYPCRELEALHDIQLLECDVQSLVLLSRPASVFEERSHDFLSSHPESHNYGGVLRRSPSRRVSAGALYTSASAGFKPVDQIETNIVREVTSKLSGVSRRASFAYLMISASCLSVKVPAPHVELLTTSIWDSQRVQMSEGDIGQYRISSGTLIHYLCLTQVHSNRSETLDHAALSATL